MGRKLVNSSSKCRCKSKKKLRNTVSSKIVYKAKLN